MPQVFHRGITGNQVKDLSSTRYCHLHYGKSNNATELSGRRTFRREPGNLPVGKGTAKASGLGLSSTIFEETNETTSIIVCLLVVSGCLWPEEHSAAEK